MAVVELGKDFLVLGGGNARGAAVGRARGEKLVGVVGRQGCPLLRVALASGQRQAKLVQQVMVEEAEDSRGSGRD